MNHLTNYYKNLCELRQNEIKILEQQLNEINMKDVLEVGRQIVNIPTDGGFSRGIGRVATAIGSGVRKAGEMVAKAGSSVERTGKQELEASKEFDVPELARQGHAADLQFGAESIIQKELPDIERHHRASIAIETGGDPNSGSGVTNDQIEALAKKRGNKNLSRAELSIIGKRENIKAAEATIPSRILGTIAQRIYEKSGKNIQGRQERLQNRGGELWYRPNDTPRGIEQHHGGHGDHMAHPELRRLWAEASKRDLDVSDAFDAFRRHDTHHVAEEFEHLLPKELVKINRKNRNNFNQALSQVQQIIDNHDIQQTKASDLRANTPFKMMESKNMKNFKQFLIETYRSPSQYSGASDYDRRTSGYGSPYDTISRQSASPGYDATEAMRIRQQSIRAMESHPEAQRLMVDALAGTWSEQHGGSGRQRRSFRSDVAERLRGAAGPKGFESFGHAVEAMVPIITTTPSWREEAIENLKQSMHPEKFENINLEQELSRMARDHSMEVASDAVRHAETRIGFLN
jgi:hypothetical protein